MKIKTSIIIVHYKAQNEILACINSIVRQKVPFLYEVIVVDNGGGEALVKLEKEYTNVRYIKSKENKGFGAGNNIGVKAANGEYIFILNPDTVLLSRCIEELVQHIDNDTKVGIVAPLLLNRDNQPNKVQGTKRLGVKEGVVSLSFLNKYFPNNPISRHYLMPDWDKKNVVEVDVISGAAFLMKKNLYKSIGGFDEHFFLYFEEVDLCRRIKEKGYTLLMVPTAKVVHIGGQSTKHLSNRNVYFEQSRKYYFTKHYGSFVASMIELSLLRVRSILTFKSR